MRKSFLFLFSALVFISTVFSQAYEGKIEYDKKKQEAFMIDYSYPLEAVEDGLVNKMEQLGYRGKEEKGLFNRDKGFRVYKDALVPDISSDRLDYVFKIETVGKKDNSRSVLYMVILKAGENARNSIEAAKARSFLNSLQPVMEEANLDFEIKNQEEVLAKAEKKLKDLKDDQESMEKKIKKLEEDLKDNAKDQEDQQKEIENQGKVLEAMKVRKKDT